MWKAGEGSVLETEYLYYSQIPLSLVCETGYCQRRKQFYVWQIPISPHIITNDVQRIKLRLILESNNATTCLSK